MKEVCVLRIGHRPERDQRVTTHVGLTARALGAKGMYLASDDKGIKRSIDDVAQRWGGNFFVEDNISWKKCIREWKDEGGTVVHLTMYGLRLTDVEESIREKEKILVVVGAEKVPGDMYELADYNVSVTTQPHSEISSLALFMDHLFEGKTLNLDFSEPEIKIIPCEHGKRFES
ncbi:tRNA (cytidine56-2'-O)-methyltransferase [Methanomicrobium sp. W14]|jgi:tRNA (cytidine56-2'-O)-methyltransferase|uniref:tRNA (cytidine(56)-2'-O)-methyltransferase n=1 Tax=Methanomicrobium sp. W14 TaxID=2817839 RepID=UPI001AE98006|nr:tRNA (cytidine(56)-2'-O)-methyltransferase [Methanomicrobium sp. W14]MBP2132582.1 tRNA (cytidine56-2'-O)-methyltransferase [Methanomicrobium sp. W14]